MMTEDVVSKLVLLVYFPIVGTGFVSGFALQWWLRKRHRDVWIDLGSPAIGNQSITTSLKSGRFLFGSRYRALNDPVVTWLIWIGRTTLMLTVGMLISFLGAMLVVALQQAPSAPIPDDTTIAGGKSSMFTHDAAGWKFHRPPNQFFFLLVFTFTYFAVVRSFLVRLRRAHADVWRELGEPLFFLNNTLRNGLRVMGFVMSDRHMAMNDRLLSIYVYIIRIAAIVAIALLIWPKDSSKFFS